MILAGDIGGTKTHLGLFDSVPARPRPIAVRTFSTLHYPDLPSMIAEFLDGDDTRNASISTATFGVAGPVIGESAELTNVPWQVHAEQVAKRFRMSRVTLLNDLQAMAYSIPVLREGEVHVLQEGEALRGGNIALIAAGTGLGEALLHSVDGRFVPSPSEGGHADFAARTDREIALMRDLTARYGRADVEHVISGRGLVNIHRVAHREPCLAVKDLAAPSAACSSAAGSRRKFCLRSSKVRSSKRSTRNRRSMRCCARCQCR